MKIAVVGGGAAGLVSALLLQEAHDVTLFEATERWGGHARTLHVEHQGATVPVEVGFRYFFPGRYPALLALLALLDLRVGRYANQFSVRRPERMGHTIVLPPMSLRHVVNLLRRPEDVMDVLRLRRFMVAEESLVAEGDWTMSLEEYLDARGYPRAFSERFLYPMMGASWGAPAALMPEFAAYSILKVMRMVEKTTDFLVVDGGLSAYVAALVGRLGCALRLGTPVESVDRDEAGVLVRTAAGEERFDAVVLAVESWAVADLLAGSEALAAWRARVTPFREFLSTIAVHGDVRLMPEHRGDWAPVNHLHTSAGVYMTEWLGREAGVEVFRSWIGAEDEDPSSCWLRTSYRHLVVTPESGRLQADIAAAQGEGGVYLAGMYVTDVDNHESALMSARHVAEALAPESETLRRWREMTESGAVPRGIDEPSRRP